jgi:hypothetical protein
VALTVRRLEPPLANELAEALGRFDCVRRYVDGEPDGGELMVREFLVQAAVPAADAGTSTTYLALDPDRAPRAHGKEGSSVRVRCSGLHSPRLSRPCAQSATRDGWVASGGAGLWRRW